MGVEYGLVIYAGRERQEGDSHDYYRDLLGSLPAQFTTVWVSDHLQFDMEPTLEGFTLISYLAAEFPRLTFGNFVAGQNYRNPALLAKMGATLQYLTGGRYILGVGAGWHEEEYRAYGYDYPSPSVRVMQLAETVEIVRAMWTQVPATYHGQYYHIENAKCIPQPDPMIPIMIGSNGTKVLQVVARSADMWSWTGPYKEWFVPKYEQLRRNCEEVGRDVGEISLCIEFSVEFPDDPQTFVQPWEDGKITNYVLGPTPKDAIEQVRPYVDFGVRRFALTLDRPTLQRFCDEVMPAFADVP
jgi:alkanesulfonate monooxygenase SsuD/methylene tetrahydromethanopterin reductase-like flavin-dependent oxidoreductase (luciferase family)